MTCTRCEVLHPIGSLTGRVKYRENWRGKLILQVEFNDSAWLGHSVHRFRAWRDATVSDIYAGAFYGNMPSEIVRGQRWPVGREALLKERGVA